MMIKKKRLLFVGTIATTTMVFAAVWLTNAQQYTFTQGGIQTYGVSMSSSKNKFFEGTGTTSHGGNSTIKTDLGNNIDFTYSNLAGGSSSVWHLVKTDGYF